MAIELLVQPQDPPISGDYTKDVALSIAHNIPTKSILTLWEDTVSVPAAKLGSYIAHAANIFQVKSGDEAISGSLSSGINYIEATETSGVITLAWVTSTTGYSYNPAHAGIYNGAGKQLLRDVCYVDGSDNIRGLANGMGFGSYILANGNGVFGGKALEDNFDILATGIQSISSSTPWTPTKGIYTLISLASYVDFIVLQYYNGSSWEGITGVGAGLNYTSSQYFDGANIRVLGSTGTQNIRWIKHK